MIDISFEINGRKVRPNQIANELEKVMLMGIKDEITKKLRSVRDPKTGERPKVTVRGKSIDALKIDVSGSEHIVELAKKRLK